LRIPPSSSWTYHSYDKSDGPYGADLDHNRLILGVVGFTCCCPPRTRSWSRPHACHADPLGWMVLHQLGVGVDVSALMPAEFTGGMR
jgi:hypothetical protein